jgi:hypothetical protein
VKKKATAAEDVACCLSVPLKLNKIAIIIIEMPKPKEPHIIGLRRPTLSTKSAGKKLPITNIHSVTGR